MTNSCRFANDINQTGLQACWLWWSSRSVVIDWIRDGGLSLLAGRVRISNSGCGIDTTFTSKCPWLLCGGRTNDRRGLDGGRLGGCVLSAQSGLGNGGLGSIVACNGRSVVVTQSIGDTLGGSVQGITDGETGHAQSLLIEGTLKDIHWRGSR